MIDQSHFCCFVATNNAPANAPNTIPKSVPVNSPNIVAPPSAAADTALDGRYASEGYAQRAQGYDWVMVTVRGQADNKLAIDINSRSDIKKPTCRFSGEAVKTAENRYEIGDKGSRLIFVFSPNSLSIDSADPVALHYPCSGGASLADVYHKL